MDRRWLSGPTEVGRPDAQKRNSGTEFAYLRVQDRRTIRREAAAMRVQLDKNLASVKLNPAPGYL